MTPAPWGGATAQQTSMQQAVTAPTSTPVAGLPQASMAQASMAPAPALGPQAAVSPAPAAPVLSPGQPATVPSAPGGPSAPAGTEQLPQPAPLQNGMLNYGGYLRLTELLAQQVPLANPPAQDELLFITVHQVYELWFKQLLSDLESARDAMTAGEAWRAKHLLHRVHAVERLLIAQVDILETMAPQDFNEFRPVLGPASGFQSVQYRELEYLSGVKDQRFLIRQRSLTEAERGRLMHRLNQPNVWDGYLSLLRSRGMPVDSDDQILESLHIIASDRAQHDDLWQLAEDLLTHDELAGAWRAGTSPWWSGRSG